MHTVVPDLCIHFSAIVHEYKFKKAEGVASDISFVKALKSVKLMIILEYGD